MTFEQQQRDEIRLILASLDKRLRNIYEVQKVRGKADAATEALVQMQDAIGQLYSASRKIGAL